MADVTSGGLSARPRTQKEGHNVGRSSRRQSAPQTAPATHGRPVPGVRSHARTGAAPLRTPADEWPERQDAREVRRPPYRPDRPQSADAYSRTSGGRTNLRPHSPWPHPDASARADVRSARSQSSRPRPPAAILVSETGPLQDLLYGYLPLPLRAHGRGALYLLRGPLRCVGPCPDRPPSQRAVRLATQPFRPLRTLRLRLP